MIKFSHKRQSISGQPKGGARSWMIIKYSFHNNLEDDDNDIEDKNQINLDVIEVLSEVSWYQVLRGWTFHNNHEDDDDDDDGDDYDDEDEKQINIDVMEVLLGVSSVWLFQGFRWKWQGWKNISSSSPSLGPGRPKVSAPVLSSFFCHHHRLHHHHHHHHHHAL